MTKKNTTTRKRTSSTSAAAKAKAAKAKAAAAAKAAKEKGKGTPKREPSKSKVINLLGRKATLTIPATGKNGQPVKTGTATERVVFGKIGMQLLALKQSGEAETKVSTMQLIDKLAGLPAKARTPSDSAYDVNTSFATLELLGLVSRVDIEGPGYGRQVTDLGAATTVS